MAKTTRKLVVEVIDARNLVPKNGHGTSSPYVVIDYYGQRKRTRTIMRDINPTWNEVLLFNVQKPSDVFNDMLELDVYHDKNHWPTSRNNSLGRIKLSSGQFVKKAPAEVKLDDAPASTIEGKQAAVTTSPSEPPANGETEKANEAATAVGEENGAAEGEKPAERVDQVEPEVDSQSVQPDDHDDDILHEPKLAYCARPSPPRPDIMASTTLGSISVIKVARTTSALPPMTRPTTLTNSASSTDPPDHTLIERFSFDLVEKNALCFRQSSESGFPPHQQQPRG
ncbi:hypothetical protein REPUB_Repub06bG0065900 [Reevesia pubescens]